MNSYTINEVSKLSGLSAHCIRAWERRYGAIKPHRQENGRRVYSESDMKRLILLQKISSFGHSISLIAHLQDSELEAMFNSMGGEVKISVSDEHASPEEYLPAILDALRNYDLNALTAELSRASENLSYRDFALKVLLVIFEKPSQLSSTQEHTLMALVRFLIGNRLAAHYHSTSKRLPKFLIAAPRSEERSLGLLLSALLVAEYKYDLVYLGGNLPEASVAEAVVATESDIILICNLRSQDMGDLKKLRALTPSEKEIWVGGVTSQVAKEIGARTFSSLTELDLWLQEEANLVTIK